MAKGDVVLDLEDAFFVLQKKDLGSGQWVIQGRHTYRGRTDALTMLNRLRAEHPQQEWRALLKQEAERYREGWKDCKEYVRDLLGVELTDEESARSGVVPPPRRSPSVPLSGVPAPPGRED